MYFWSRLSLILFCFTPGVFVFSQNSKGLSDQHATAETKALYRNLGKLADQHILFGHQHATQYGHGWYGDENRSDVKSVTGSHPAVIGVDFSGFTGRPSAEVANEKKSVKKTIEDEYNRGGVITVAWHFNNPVSKTNFYWNDSTAAAAVPMIIPGGSHHADYKVILDSIAAFVKTLKGSDGKMVPLIFRPFHEFDGDWFWWGAGHCSIDEFKSLWRFTVTYMRDTLGVHNLIYAFSPDNRFITEEKYLERYPGDGFVDLLGTDNYGDFGRDGHYDLDAGYQKLKIVSDYAQKTKKLAAFTETGLESIPDSTWWTEKLLPTLRRSNLKLCYVLVWRNDARSPTHFYAPFPGQKSEKDFLKFYGDPYTLFESDLKTIYRK
jgi:mannan endo-1,4-beta-mannosidase